MPRVNHPARSIRVAFADNPCSITAARIIVDRRGFAAELGRAITMIRRVLRLV
jgi:hypothetical protein